MSTPDYHDESGAHLGWWAVPFALSVLIPGLWWTWADRPFALRPDLVITMTVLVGAVALVLLASISRLFRYRLRWSLGVATVALTVLFQWSTLTAAGSALADTLGVGFVQDVFPVAMGGALLWLAARRAHELAFAVVIGGSVTVAVIALAFNAMTLAGPAPRPAQQTDHAATRPVLLLVLDGYARADWMRDEYGFGNGEFLAEL